MIISLSKILDINKFEVSKLASVTNLMILVGKIRLLDKHISNWSAPFLSLDNILFNQVLMDALTVARMRTWPKTPQNNNINSREMREPDTSLKFPPWQLQPNNSN